MGYIQHEPPDVNRGRRKGLDYEGYTTRAHKGLDYYGLYTTRVP